jgi:hypothetical protein
MTNRFIKTYQRMNGPLQDYYYAQELKNLPKIEYKVNVYFSGVMKDYMQALYNTELSGKKITNPMDLSELTKDTLDYPTHVVQMYSDLPKAPEEGEIYDFWFVVETKKIYSWIPTSKSWGDMTDDAVDMFKIVYIGDDKSQIGTKDIKLNFEDYGIKGDGGSYFIYYLSSDVPLRTNSIYKVLDTKNSTLLNVNKTFVYGNEFEHLSNWSDVEERVNQIYNLIKDDVPSSISEDEVTIYVMYSILTGFFGSVDVINNEGNLNQKFKILAENNKYIIDISFKQTENDVETTVFKLYKEFDSVDELGKYILSDDYKLVLGEEVDLAQRSREFLKQCNITPKYSNESLPDLQNEPINAVMSSDYSQKVFNFYFYTGKEFIQGDGGSDTSKETIVKEVTEESINKFENTGGDLIFKTPLTEEEFNKLKNYEANLIIKYETVSLNLSFCSDLVFINENDKQGVIYSQAVTLNLFLRYFNGYFAINLKKLTQITAVPITFPYNTFDIHSGFTTSPTIATDTTYSSYPYKYTYKLEGVTQNCRADVVLSVDDATSGNYAPITECAPGLVYLWGKINNPPTVLSLIIFKEGGLD